MKTFAQFLTEANTMGYGIYSYRPLTPTCATALYDWMIESRIPNPVPPNELHCTVIYSPTYIPNLSPDGREVAIKPATYGITMLESALTMTFKSSALLERWNEANNLGGTHKYPSFIPHVTLSYAVPQSFQSQMDELKPPPFPMVFESEVIEPLVEDIQERIKLAEAALAINPTQVYIPHSSLNLARSKMPQIASGNVPEFLKFVAAHGVRVTNEKVTVSVLHPVQSEIDLKKVEGMMLAAPERALSKPVITSEDNYILDGHHRWLALLNRDPHFRIDTYRVHCKIKDLLSYANSFPLAFYKDIGES